MSEAVRVDDITTGHGDFGSQTVIEGSPNVFINGKPAVTVGDKVSEHTYEDNTHEGVVSTGSPTVFVNGKPKARKGDSVSCGGTLDSGSSNVFVN